MMGELPSGRVALRCAGVLVVRLGRAVACFDGFGPCSSGVRTMGTGAMGTRWVHDTDQCEYASAPVIMENGESVVLGTCGGDGEAATLGLRYAP
jgi:hypothetical protein